VAEPLHAHFQKLSAKHKTSQSTDNNNLGELYSFIEQVQDQMIEFVESRK
jgi:hypothetical protein